MSAADPSVTRPGARRTEGNRDVAAPARHRRSTETKAAFKTTELVAYVLAVAAVLIAGLVIDEANEGGLGARQVWLYVTILTVGYLLSRGLAKSGSRDPYWEEDDRR